MSRASETILEELHNTIAETLKEELKRYASGEYDDKEETEDDEGVVTVIVKKKSIPASLIQSTIKYLKDNGIDRPEEDEPDPEDLLSDELPSFGEEA